VSRYCNSRVGKSSTCCFGPARFNLGSYLRDQLQGKSGRKIHAFIAGADRVANNGDTANKISTYQISTLCKSIPMQHQPKVIVCAPLTTLDLSMDSGDSILIEERSEVEACTVRGVLYNEEKGEPDAQNNVVTVLFTPKGTRCWNPAFDITDARLIDAISTEIGVAMKQGDTFDLRKFARSQRDGMVGDLNGIH